MNVYSYLRYSRGHQRLGRSEKRQTGTAQDFCKRKGWTLDETLYADRGVSGFRGKNASTGTLSAFLADVLSGKVRRGDILIVESLDRLSRQDIDDAYDLFRGILKSGVEIITLDPERHYDKAALKSITGVIEPLVIMARANEESARKSSRGTDVWAAKRANARGDGKPISYQCPRWLRLDRVGKKSVVIPERVEVVAHIFQMCLDGHGCIKISRTLNQEGVKPFCAYLVFPPNSPHSDFQSDDRRVSAQGKMRDRSEGSGRTHPRLLSGGHYDGNLLARPRHPSQAFEI